MVPVRIVMGALIAMFVVVIAIPVVVLVDLIAGGTGLGLCPQGLGVCETSLYTIVELSLVLFGLAVALGFAIAGCHRFLSKRTRSSVFGR
jgi:hypothetical protein